MPGSQFIYACIQCTYRLFKSCRYSVHDVLRMNTDFVFLMSFFPTPKHSAVSVWMRLLKSQNSHYLEVCSTW